MQRSRDGDSSSHLLLLLRLEGEEKKKGRSRNSLEGWTLKLLWSPHTYRSKQNPGPSGPRPVAEPPTSTCEGRDRPSDGGERDRRPTPLLNIRLTLLFTRSKEAPPTP